MSNKKKNSWLIGKQIRISFEPLHALIESLTIIYGMIKWLALYYYFHQTLILLVLTRNLSRGSKDMACRI
jgi:hypothetical protein